MRVGSIQGSPLLPLVKWNIYHPWPCSSHVAFLIIGDTSLSITIIHLTIHNGYSAVLSIVLSLQWSRTCLPHNSTVHYIKLFCLNFLSNFYYYNPVLDPQSCLYGSLDILTKFQHWLSSFSGALIPVSRTQLCLRLFYLVIASHILGTQCPQCLYLVE